MSIAKMLKSGRDLHFVLTFNSHLLNYCSLLGSSSPSQLDQNLKDLEKGPLPEELVDALEEVWDVLKKDTPGVWPPSRAQQVK